MFWTMLRKVVEKMGRDQQKSTLKCQARNTAGKTGDTTYTFNIKCEYDGSVAVWSKEGRSVFWDYQRAAPSLWRNTQKKCAVEAKILTCSE